MGKDENIYFQILDEVSKNSEVTQRSLSRRLGVALGLTNLYIKRLGKKGLIKVVNIKPNRLRYELTPSGIAQKTSMAFQYVQDSYVFYREARRSLTNSFGKLKTDGVRSVVLYGTGDLAEIALLSLQEAQLDLAGVVSPDNAGQLLCGRPVREPAALPQIAYDKVVVVDRNRNEAARVFAEFGVSPADITWVGE